jgi:hypothetical protein
MDWRNHSRCKLRLWPSPSSRTIQFFFFPVDKAYFYLAIVSNEHARPNLMILPHLVPWMPSKSNESKSEDDISLVTQYPHTTTPVSTPQSPPQFCKRANLMVYVRRCKDACCQGTDRLVAVCPRDLIMVCHCSGIVPQDAAAGVVCFALRPLLYTRSSNSTCDIPHL